MHRPLAAAALLLAALAACSDVPTVPDPGPGGDVRLSAAPAASAPAGTLLLTAAQTVAYNAGTWESGNAPMAVTAGGRVEWVERSDSASVVHGLDLASGARGVYQRVAGWIENTPVAAGPFSLWTDERGRMVVRDARTGQLRTLFVEWRPRVSSTGRLSFVQPVPPFGRITNAAVYDGADEEPRRLTAYDREGGEQVMYVAAEGNLAAWTVGDYDRWTGSLQVMDLATGVRREVAREPRPGVLSQPSISGGRVAWAGSDGVRVYDVATGASRRVSADGDVPLNVQISGDLVVWEDARSQGRDRYPHHEVHAFDLVTNTETTVAAGAAHEGWPGTDGARIVWSEKTADGWNVRLAAVQRQVTPADLASLVDAMAASGEIANAGVAESLRAFLGQASRAHDAGDTAKERDALERFRDEVQRLAGRQIAAPAAARLAAMVNAMLPTLGAGPAVGGTTEGGTLAGR